MMRISRKFASGYERSKEYFLGSRQIESTEQFFVCIPKLFILNGETIFSRSVFD